MEPEVDIFCKKEPKKKDIKGYISLAAIVGKEDGKEDGSVEHDTEGNIKINVDAGNVKYPDDETNMGKLYRIGNLEENNGINLHGNIIFRNNWLRLKVYNLFLDGNSLCNPIQKRTQEVYTGFPCGIEFSQPFYNIDVRLRNNLDSSKEDNQNKDNQ